MTTSETTATMMMMAPASEQLESQRALGASNVRADSSQSVCQDDHCEPMASAGPARGERQAREEAALVDCTPETTNKTTTTTPSIATQTKAQARTSTSTLARPKAKPKSVVRLRRSLSLLARFSTGGGGGGNMKHDSLEGQFVSLGARDACSLAGGSLAVRASWWSLLGAEPAAASTSVDTCEPELSIGKWPEMPTDGSGRRKRIRRLASELGPAGQLSFGRFISRRWLGQPKDNSASFGLLSSASTVSLNIDVNPDAIIDDEERNESALAATTTNDDEENCQDDESDQDNGRDNGPRGANEPAARASTLPNLEAYSWKRQHPKRLEAAGSPMARPTGRLTTTDSAAAAKEAAAAKLRHRTGSLASLNQSLHSSTRSILNQILSRSTTRLASGANRRESKLADQRRLAPPDKTGSLEGGKKQVATDWTAPSSKGTSQASGQQSQWVSRIPAPSQTRPGPRGPPAASEGRKPTSKTKQLLGFASASAKLASGMRRTATPSTNKTGPLSAGQVADGQQGGNKWPAKSIGGAQTPADSRSGSSSSAPASERADKLGGGHNPTKQQKSKKTNETTAASPSSSREVKTRKKQPATSVASKSAQKQMPAATSSSAKPAADIKRRPEDRTQGANFWPIR